MGFFDESLENSFAMNITSMCNTRCAYCYRSANSVTCQLDYESIEAIVQYYDSIGSGHKYVILSGGEVFVHPRALDIVRLLLSRGFHVRLQTNGMAVPSLDEKSLDTLSDPMVSFKVSLDGSTARTHEMYRAKGTFARTIEALRTIRSINPNLGVTTVVTRNNLSDIPQLLDLLLDLDVGGFTYNVLRLAGDAATLPNSLVVDEDVVTETLLPLLFRPPYLHLLNGTNIYRYALLQTPRISYPNQLYFFNDGSIYLDHRLASNPIGHLGSTSLDEVMETARQLPALTRGSISTSTYQAIVRSFKEVIRHG